MRGLFRSAARTAPTLGAVPIERVIIAERLLDLVISPRRTSLLLNLRLGRLPYGCRGLLAPGLLRRLLRRDLALGLLALATKLLALGPMEGRFPVFDGRHPATWPGSRWRCSPWGAGASRSTFSRSVPYWHQWTCGSAAAPRPCCNRPGGTCGARRPSSSRAASAPSQWTTPTRFRLS